jgi:two-component system, sensor histidine kinase
MSELDSIQKYFLNKIQTIELSKSGIVINSNNILFKTIKNQDIKEIHPFFDILSHIFSVDNDEVNFNAIQLDLKDKIIIADIVIFTGSKTKTPTILIFDNTENYDIVQEITQQKNEIFINDFFKTQKLIRNEEERILKNEFLAGITDDLKTPITSISGLLELFQKGNLTFDQVELLKIITGAMSHLNRLVNDVLDLSKAEIGELNIELKPFDFDDLIQNIQKLFSNKFLLNGISFKIIKSDRIPKYLIGDKDRVMQIMNNLLENAHKYTKKGEVIFEIKIDNSSPSKIGLAFIVSDTGIGFDESSKKQLFKNFKKPHENDTDGPGIGLSIVGNLIKLLKGSIKYESAPNQGSTFNVFLPFAIDINNDRKAKTNEAVFKKINIDKKVNVLIIDDDEINQLVLMKQLINHEGFFIDIANDSKKALDMISKDSYSILFIDLNMSGNNGFQTIESVRNSENKKTKKIPIIALTGYESEAERKKCKLLKVNEYLVKPYTNQNLFQDIYKVLKLK